MASDELRAVMDRAADLYLRGEILAAHAEWEHAVDLDNRCLPALRALRDLEANYDLLDETLRPGGHALDLSRYRLPAESSSGPAPGYGATHADSGIVTAPADLADTQPAEFLDSQTGRLPGTLSVGATFAEIAATQPTIQDLSREREAALETMSTVELAGVAAVAPDSDSTARTSMAYAKNAADADVAHGDRDLDHSFSDEVTVETHPDHLDAMELAAFGMPSGNPDEGDDLATRATEEVAFAHAANLDIGLAERVAPDPSLAPLSQPPNPSARDRLQTDPLEPAQQKSLSPDEIERTVRDDVERAAPFEESPGERTRRRVKGYIERAQRAHSRGDTACAIIALELAFAEDPDSAVAHKLLNLHREAIAAILELHIGDFAAAPRLGVTMDELVSAHIDARTAFLLSRVDGVMSVEELLDVAGMPRIEALRHVSSMILRGILILT